MPPDGCEDKLPGDGEVDWSAVAQALSQLEDLEGLEYEDPIEYYDQYEVVDSRRPECWSVPVPTDRVKAAYDTGCGIDGMDFAACQE